MLTRRSVVWCKRESASAYGTDVALSNADQILAWDIDVQIKGENLEREILRDTLSPLNSVVGMKEVELTFKTELKGIGATTNIGNWPLDDLFSGCGFNTGVYTGTTTVYSLQSAESSLSSVCFAVFIDELKHKILGARGNVKFNMQAGQYGVCEWNFKGLYNAVTAATVPVFAADNVNPPIVYNANFQISGFSPVCSAAEIDLGNDIVRRESVNAIDGVHSFRLTGRRPKMQFDADAVAESSNPFWGDWAGNVVDTFGIQIGSSITNICKLTGYWQVIQPKYGDDEGVRKYDVEAALVSSNVSTGNDELTLTFI